MKKKDITYTAYQSLIKDKDKAVNAFVTRTLAMTREMFLYTGLPDSIPSNDLERLLQTNGHVFVTDVNGTLYALTGAKGGEHNPYDMPTIYTVANAALQLSANYDIDADGVLMQNDCTGTGLLPIIGKYAVLHTDAQISLNTASILTRITMLICASDDKTKQSADEYVKHILDGEFSVIGENAFFKGVTMQTAPTNNSTYITQLIELIQYYKASLYNELGLNANYNMKRERLNLGEVNMNVDVLLPYIDNMLHERQKAVEKINAKYGTCITVELNSAWRYEHENFVSLERDAELTHVHPEDDNALTEPTESVEPTEPTESVEPTEPTEPTESVEPTEPKKKENED